MWFECVVGRGEEEGREGSIRKVGNMNVYSQYIALCKEMSQK